MCTAAGSNGAVVIVGRVVVDSGPGWGKGPARVAVEEAVQNLPPGVREVEVKTGAGTSCYRRLSLGERHILTGAAGPGGSIEFYAGSCSNRLLLEGNEHIVAALRRQARRDRAFVVGKVIARGRDRVVADARVTARQGGASYEARTDSHGHYALEGLAPGQYRLSVAKPGFVVEEYFNLVMSKNSRPVERMDRGFVNDDSVKRLSRHGSGVIRTVELWADSCEVVDLALWPDGRIAGVVRGADGLPKAGVKVQAFEWGNAGHRPAAPLRTATSDVRGRYLLERLPGGSYMVGVKAPRQADESAYPPTRRVEIADSALAGAIDLIVPPPQLRAELRVTVRDRSGKPVPKGRMQVDATNGSRRSFTVNFGDGFATVPVFVGESYVVKAYDARDPAASGSRFVSIAAEKESITIPILPPLP